MARSKRPIRLSTTAKETLSRKIDQKLDGAARVSDVRSIQSLVDKYGRKEVERRYAKVAGIKEASARDAVTRFLTGKRAPSAKSLGKLSGAQRSIQVSRVIRNRPTIRPAITATFKISKTEWPGKATARDLSHNERVMLADAIEAGDMDAVADIVLGGYGRNFRDNLSDVENIEDFDL